MAVIEALMILYAKEISSGDRVPNAIRRWVQNNTIISYLPNKYNNMETKP